MRRNNAELEHDAALRPSLPHREEAPMTALIRVDTHAGRERPLVIACLAMLVAVCWACLVFHALRLAAVGPSWRPPEPGLVLGMWGAMLAAIMLPGATPTILLFARINRLVRTVRFPNLATLMFVAGYLAAWGGFGALATLAQWALHEAGTLDAGMAIDNQNACGLALVAAGAYQWTSAKHACLEHCRAPLSFMVTGWRVGLPGGWRMGAAHGLYCIGCYWLLMLLLFVVGVTNLGALVGLAGLVLAEKLLPSGVILACIAGLALVAWGTLLLFPQS
jgi:predicted metal-binding membrane protein